MCPFPQQHNKTHIPPSPTTPILPGTSVWVDLPEKFTSFKGWAVLVGSGLNKIKQATVQTPAVLRTMGRIRSISNTHTPRETASQHTSTWETSSGSGSGTVKLRETLYRTELPGKWYSVGRANRFSQLSSAVVAFQGSSSLFATVIDIGSVVSVCAVFSMCD